VHFLLPDDHPAVSAELEALQKVAAKRAEQADASKNFKWTNLHMQLAEKSRDLFWTRGNIARV